MEKTNTTRGVLMKQSRKCGSAFRFTQDHVQCLTGYVRWLITVIVLLITMDLWAQDASPTCPLADLQLQNSDTLRCRSQQVDTLLVPSLRFPVAFKQTTVNQLTDSLHLLRTFWKRLQVAQTCYDTLHIVHVGDSHIRGHIFPQTVGERLRQTFHGIRYTDYGINGACAISFVRPERISHIVSLKPDLLILSFGTNESHNRRYNALMHYRQMDELVCALRRQLPHVPILMTTPPGSYESVRLSRRRRSYKIPPRTPLVVETIRRYADDNGIALWDLYTICGGIRRAVLNWWESGLMRPDHVHFFADGYRLQGELLYQAILRAYNHELTEE